MDVKATNKTADTKNVYIHKISAGNDATKQSQNNANSRKALLCPRRMLENSS